jgi:hypothetical protein
MIEKDTTLDLNTMTTVFALAVQFSFIFCFSPYSQILIHVMDTLCLRVDIRDLTKR